jgi:hypothetical protein
MGRLMNAVPRCTVSAFALVSLAAAPALAQSSIEVSPLRVELKAQAGGNTTQAVTVSNTGTDPVRVRARLSDWYLSPDGAPQFADASDATYSATAWTRIAPPEQVIEAGKEAIVRFSLTVPANAAPAGYRTGILFEFGPASGDPVARGRQVIVRSRIATLIYVNVGEPPATVELTDLRIRQVANQPTQIVALLKNTSRRTVRTRGTLIVYNSAGAAVAEAVVPDVPILPESEREVAITALDPEKPSPPPGEYRVEVKIDVGMPAVLVGETTLKVS